MIKENQSDKDYQSFVSYALGWHAAEIIQEIMCSSPDLEGWTSKNQIHFHFDAPLIPFLDRALEKLEEHGLIESCQIDGDIQIRPCAKHSPSQGDLS